MLFYNNKVIGYKEIFNIYIYLILNITYKHFIFVIIINMKYFF
jgi:hypothetical protein